LLVVAVLGVAHLETTTRQTRLLVLRHAIHKEHQARQLQIQELVAQVVVMKAVLIQAGQAARVVRALSLFNT
jgi:hypothetical protein